MVKKGYCDETRFIPILVIKMKIIIIIIIIIIIAITITITITIMIMIMIMTMIIITIIINDNFYSALSKSSKALYNQGKKVKKVKNTGY